MKPDFPPAAAPRALVDDVALVVLAALLAVRPLISETWARLDLAALAGVEVVGGGPTPAATAWLDFWLLCATVPVGIRHWARLGRAPLLAMGLVLLAASVVISTTFASEQRAALNAGANLVVLVSACVALGAVLRRGWRVRLVLALLLATGAATAAKNVAQRAYEFEDTRRTYEEQIEEGGAGQAYSPGQENYRRRLYSNEAYGYGSHPNVAASTLAVAFAAALGLLVAGVAAVRREKEAAAGPVVAGGLCALLAVGVWLTGSLGGFAALLIATVIVLKLCFLPGVLLNRRLVFGTIVFGYLLVVGVGAAWGLSRGTLPHTSLAFRWEYWQAAGETYVEQPWTGIGRQNFRPYYLEHKSAESTEEVENPHNVWISLLVELGPIGLLGGVGVVLAVLWLATPRAREPSDADGWRAVGGARDGPRSDAVPPWAWGGASAVVLGFAGWGSSVPLSNGAVLFLWLVQFVGVWSFALLLALQVLPLVLEGDSPGGWRAVVIGGLAGGYAALVQGLIGFALLTPSGLATAGMAFALAVGARRGEQERARARLHPLATTGAAALLAAQLWFVALPTQQVNGVLERTEAGLRTLTTPREAYALLEGAGEAVMRIDMLASESLVTVARWAFELLRSVPEESEVRASAALVARELVDTAAQRNPRSFSAVRLQAELTTWLAQTTDEVDAWERAYTRWAEVARRHPTSPRMQIAAGNAAFATWRGAVDEAERARFAVLARKHFEAALAIDAVRLEEVAVKLRVEERARVGAALEQLGHADGAE